MSAFLLANECGVKPLGQTERKEFERRPARGPLDLAPENEPKLSERDLAWMQWMRTNLKCGTILGAGHIPTSAAVAELADAQDLGSCPARGGGSTPPGRTSFSSKDLWDLGPSTCKKWLTRGRHPPSFLPAFPRLLSFGFALPLRQGRFHSGDTCFQGRVFLFQRGLQGRVLLL